MSFDKDLDAINKRKLAELERIISERSAIASINQPIILTDNNFKQQVTKYPLLVVDFWAPWCGPCRIVGPIIDQLAREYSGKVIFGKLNVDENQGIASLFSVNSIPTMMIFKGGNVVDVIVGAIPKGSIEAKIRQHM